MKALSIRQPWAELILQERKTIELRTWETKYRGRIAIHAAKAIKEAACVAYGLDPASLIRGALVGTVEIVEMVPLDDERWEALRDEHLALGAFPGDLIGWRLANPRRLPEPIPLRGRLGLFNIPDELLNQTAEPVGQTFQPAQPKPGEGSRSVEKPAPPSVGQTGKSAPIERVGKPATRARRRLTPSALYRVGVGAEYDPEKPFELRVVPRDASDYALALYQWPVAANAEQGANPPKPVQPQRLVELSGDPLRAVADHVLETLRKAGYKTTDLSRERRKPFRLDEETGLRLGLLFLAVKPLTRMDRIEAISSALRAMPSEEAYYWFSKCTAGRNAINAQRALRILLAGG